MKNTLLIQFDLHHRLYNNVLHGFTDKEANQRPCKDNNINHVKYLAGHLLNSQYGLASISGADFKKKWHELFAVMGQSEARDEHSYPNLEEIIAEWNGMHDQIRSGLRGLTAVELNNPPPCPFDQVAESVGELWAFINHHQAYHIGQIGIIRKAFGKEPMRYD